MMKITKSLLEIDTIKSTDKIGILLSGGMDSALLLYLLALYTSNELCCFTVKKHDGADLYVNGIVDWINRKLGKSVSYSFRVGNPNLYHEKIIVNALYLIRNECDVFYLAGNAYPPSILPSGPNRIRVNDVRVKQPLFDCYKTDILSSYVEHDIMDLLDYTHTCTEQSIGRCNICWQCRERQWAFNELQIEDKSTK